MMRLPDIRDIEPCNVCVRNKYNEFDEDGSAVGAGAYLVSCALDTADSEAQLDEPQDRAASKFMTDGSPRAPKGAVGHCGRKIGRGNCPSWELDLDTQVIVAKSEEEK